MRLLLDISFGFLMQNISCFLKTYLCSVFLYIFYPLLWLLSWISPPSYGTVHRFYRQPVLETWPHRVGVLL